MCGKAAGRRAVPIDQSTIIGAWSVVTDDNPVSAVAVGNPAKVIRYINNEQY